MKGNNRGVQTEVDASYLYQKFAEHEPDAAITNIFRQMSEVKRGHAEVLLKKGRHITG